MADREKVIQWLEVAYAMAEDAAENNVFPDGVGEEAKQLYADTIALLKEQEPGWISVKDRLPATENFVLFTVGERVIYGYYDGKDWYEYEGCWDTDVIYLGPGERVTHWMPLPELPKEET